MGRWMMPQNRSPRLNLDWGEGRKSRIDYLTVEIAIANAKMQAEETRFTRDSKFEWYSPVC